MTASFVIAMSIAITGPPTDEELAGVGAVVDDLGEMAGAAFGDAGDQLCAALPEEFCGVSQTTTATPPGMRHAEVTLPPEPPAFSGPASAEAPETPAFTVQDDASLLGGAAEAASAARPRAERAQRAPSERRRAPSRRAEQPAPPRRASRAQAAARPNPVEVQRHAEMERLNEAIAAVLAEPPARQQIALPPEQAEQEAQRDDAYWDEEREDDWSEEEEEEYWSPY
jgi:hypothetical protein